MWIVSTQHCCTWTTRDIWLRRDFNFAEPLDSAKPRALALRLHHDEDAEIFLNGVEVAREPRWTSGYVELPLACVPGVCAKPCCVSYCVGLFLSGSLMRGFLFPNPHFSATSLRCAFALINFNAASAESV